MSRDRVVVALVDCGKGVGVRFANIVDLLDVFGGEV